MGRRTIPRTTRWVLAAALAAGGYASCSAPFDPPAYVNSLRVLAVVIDQPYGHPGELISFNMRYHDGREVEAGLANSPTIITWIGGCWNPPGDDYYGCYESLGTLFSGLQSGQLPPEVQIGPNLTQFQVTVPDDVLANVGKPPAGAKVALGFVFFMLCAGELRPVDQAGTTEAGAFPIGCFDSNGRELGADGFVPGYTQIYVFEDGRTNANPVVEALTVDGEPIAPDALPPKVKRCDVSAEERRKTGCAAIDEFTECETIAFDVQVPNDVAQIDPDAFAPDGEPLHEVVWVSYFTDGGDFDSATKLVSDAVEGIQGDHGTEWVPPDVAGLYTVWAVVRDNRGGSTIVEHLIEVTE